MNLRIDLVAATILAAFLSLLTSCASGPPDVPYPAFIVVDELPDAFVAGLPGVRAKQLTGDSHTRRSGSRILIPADWSFSSGASPGQSVEIYILAGELSVGEYSLTEGGYAYIPPGSTGLPMRSDQGAAVLYFLDTAQDDAVIQTPLITNSNLLDWDVPVFDDGNTGISTKALRDDPGSGARTYLLKIDPGSVQSWRYESQALEGYLLSGSVVETECVAGKPATFGYSRGGYFHRPPGAVHGGPEATSTGGAVWLMRTPSHMQIKVVADCGAVTID